MMEDLVSSQQFHQDEVRKIQEVQKELKVGLDQLSRQMSQLATSMSEMRGNDDNIPSQVQHPHRANVSQVTLTPGKELKEPGMKKTDEHVEAWNKKLGSSMDVDEEKWENDSEQQVMKEACPVPKELDPLNQVRTGSSSSTKDMFISSSRETKEKEMKVILTPRD